MWNEEELRQVIAQGETTTVELKVARIGANLRIDEFGKRRL